MGRGSWLGVDYLIKVICSSLGAQDQCKKESQNHSIKNRPLHHRYSISVGVVCIRVYLGTIFDVFFLFFFVFFCLNIPNELKSTVCS